MGAKHWLVVALGGIGAASCTMVSGGDELQVYDVGDPQPVCAPCAGSAECESGNCRVVVCSSGQVTVCLPENIDDSSSPAQVESACAGVCQ